MNTFVKDEDDDVMWGRDVGAFTAAACSIPPPQYMPYHPPPLPRFNSHRRDYLPMSSVVSDSRKLKQLGGGKVNSFRSMRIDRSSLVGIFAYLDPIIVYFLRVRGQRDSDSVQLQSDESSCGSHGRHAAAVVAVVGAHSRATSRVVGGGGGGDAGNE